MPKKQCAAKMKNGKLCPAYAYHMVQDGRWYCKNHVPKRKNDGVSIWGTPLKPRGSKLAEKRRQFSESEKEEGAS